jgi:hypothetical protein
MNNPDHISESLETIFRVKMLKVFDADPESGMEKIWILDPGWKKFGSGIQDGKIFGSGPATLECTVPYIKNPPLKLGRQEVYSVLYSVHLFDSLCLYYLSRPGDFPILEVNGELRS